MTISPIGAATAISVLMSALSYLVGLYIGSRAGHSKGYNEGHRDGSNFVRVIKPRSCGKTDLGGDPVDTEGLDLPIFTKVFTTNIVIEPKRPDPTKRGPF